MSLRKGNTIIAGSIADTSAFANASEVVHKTGEETINGKKIFTDIAWQKNKSYAYTDTPASDKSFCSWDFMDKNNKMMGAVEFIKNTDGNDVIQINVFGKTGKWCSRPLGIGQTSSGHIYTYAPECDDFASIVTTTGISKGSNGYVKFGNGLIIQWGTTTSRNTNLTFPTAFTGTYQGVVSNYSGGSSGYASVFFRPVSNTTFQIGADFGEGTTCYWIAIGY